jgi:hypothetical protein
MLGCLRGKASPRKLGLFCAACCRRVWPLLGAVCRHAVEVSERFADGLAREQDPVAALRLLRKFREKRGPQRLSLSCAADAAGMLAMRRGIGDGLAGVCGVTASAAAARAYSMTGEAYVRGPWEAAREEEQAAQRALLRDLFGPLPFRDVAVEPAWRTPAVLGLAEAACGERLMPAGILDRHHLLVLADALEDAGCAEPDLLAHCRDPGPHAPGCWAVDAILARS